MVLFQFDRKKGLCKFVDVTCTIPFFIDSSKFLINKKGGKHPPDIESIISKEIEPVRPGRINSRKIKPKSVVYFTYRFD